MAYEVMDNSLALGQLVGRCERTGTSWGLFFEPTRAIPANRYELRVYDGPARAIYRGATATHAASKAMECLDDHQVGWAEPATSPDHCEEADRG